MSFIWENIAQGRMTDFPEVLQNLEVRQINAFKSLILPITSVF